MNSYSITYVFDRKKPLKIALLAIALGVDLVNIAFLISAIGGDYIKFAYLAVGIIVMLALRLPTLKLTYSIKYVFKDGLCVYRIYPHKTETVFCLSGDFTVFSVAKENVPTLREDVKKLYYAEGDAEIFLIDCKDGKFALALDDYMLALILSFYGKKAIEYGKDGEITPSKHTDN